MLEWYIWEGLALPHTSKSHTYPKWLRTHHNKEWRRGHVPSWWGLGRVGASKGGTLPKHQPHSWRTPTTKGVTYWKRDSRWRRLGLWKGAVVLPMGLVKWLDRGGLHPLPMFSSTITDIYPPAPPPPPSHHSPFLGLWLRQQNGLRHDSVWQHHSWGKIV